MLDRIFNNKKGSITLITAVAGVFLMGIVALVTDVGNTYYQHARLQTATNAAWKAGYDKMAQLRTIHNPITEDDMNAVKTHMLEVMAANGFPNMTAEQLKIVFTENKTNLKIEANTDVELFFMNVFDINSTKVSSGRAGGGDVNGDNASILPVAIPHGEVHDLSWKTYEWIPFEGDEGFATGTEYIIKLGEAEGDEPLGKEDKMIYIPTGFNGGNNAISANQHSDNATMRAYGAIFWALQIDERDKESMTPAYWILSNNGGGFLTRYSDAYEARLTNDYNVDHYQFYTEDILRLLKQVGAPVNTKEEINTYLTGINNGQFSNDRIVPLTNRPQIAIYSSQDALDPVEQILVAAKIPYGTYALPNSSMNSNGWKREEIYNESRNTKIFDLEILNGELDKYDWIHLHHEDFTGLTLNDGSSYNKGSFATNCQNIKPGCFQNIAINTKKSSSKSQADAINVLKNLACANCREKMLYTTSSQVTGAGRKQTTTYYATLTGWSQSEEEMNAICKTAKLTRCQTCGRFDINNFDDQTNFSGCKFYNYLHNTFGYTDDYSLPHAFNDSDKNLDAQSQCNKWFSQATAYQKMKWDVARKIKEHILHGGFMYTQCFAAETLDLSLQQGEFYRTRNLQASYDACMTYQNFKYKQLPKKGGYSSIYNSSYGNSTIKTEYKYSPLCQVSGTPNSGSGATSTFSDACIKAGIDKMAYVSSNSSAWQYLGGRLKNEAGESKGQFALMGGHSAQNIHAKRFVLNNILYGSTSDKETSIGTHLSGKTKYQYGCIDPDNDGNHSSEDYLNRMLYGFSSPLNFADVIGTDKSRYTQESKNVASALAGKISLTDYQPNSIVIVPIIGVPDSVKDYQSTVTAIGDAEVERDDITIYDLKVGSENGAASSDELDGKYSPTETGIDNLKNSVQIIGFAKFRIMSEDEYTRSEVLGNPLQGQIRGEFLGYVVDPREMESLLAQYNAGQLH